jgi:hypothetical protein
MAAIRRQSSNRINTELESKMKLNLIPIFTARNWTLLTSILLLTLVSACGGGNGSAGKQIGGDSGGSSSSTSTGGSTTTGTASTGVAGAIQFVSSVPADASIVFQGTGGSGRTTTAVLTYQVLDTQGNPLSGVTVNFVNNNTELATLSPASGTTNSSGNVVATVTSVGPTNNVVPPAGTLTVTASAKGASATISAVSNLVIVSTGAPAAKSFTIAPSVSNIEGYDFADTTTTIAVLVTDVNGNPVVDGTAVAATTNEGNIGSASSSNPGCTTVNGICDLVFTSQDPRYLGTGPNSYTDIGIATITLTAPGSGNTTITGSVQLTQSGSWPSVFYYNSAAAIGAISADTYPVGWVFMGGAAEPFTIPDNNPPWIIYGTSCTDVTLLLTDEVGNPMAYGTAVAGLVGTTAITGVGPTPIGNTPLNDPIVDFTIPGPASAISQISLLNGLNPTNQSALYNPSINGTLVDVPISGCPGSSGFAFSLNTTSVKGDKAGLNILYVTP